MKPATSVPDRSGEGGSVWDGTFIYIIGVCLAFFVAVNSRSFWIDEAYTASIATEKTLHGWWLQVYGQKTSDLQMPLYTLWIWCCEKWVGRSEFALRAVNLFWFLPALLILVRSLKGRPSLKIFAFLIAAFSPFAWYYLNEARAYTMQLSASLVLYSVLFHWWQNRPTKHEVWWVSGFAVALILLCGSSLLSMIFAVSPILLTAVLLPKEQLKKLVKNHRLIIGATLFFLTLLGIYYLWTMHIGARATPIATTDWRNPFFIAYELLGFTGLGPGRLEIRSSGFKVFQHHAVPLIIFGMTVATVIFSGLSHFASLLSRGKLLGCIVSFALPLSFVLIASSIMTFRVLGRHFAAVWPIAIFLLSFGIVAMWKRNRVGKCLVVVFFSFYLISDLSIRFATRHQRDDYRSAAIIAKTALAKGETVWWNADRMGAWYYGVPLTQVGEKGKAISVENPTVDSLQRVDSADWVISSRADVYDNGGKLAEFLSREPFGKVTNLMAFTVWERIE